MRIFFYGLFMDQAILAAKGIFPSEVCSGFVDGFRLRIGERATLVGQVNSRTYGMMMTITPTEASLLYADDSVADYVPEPVMVQLGDGSRDSATCYNLPAQNVAGTNTEYASALLDLATRLEFPDEYVEQIRSAGAARQAHSP